MSGAPVFVWTGTRIAGVFGSLEHAIGHCRVVANDHRRKIELAELEPGAWRYVGPRGRRHGRRLVAYLCTSEGAQLLGVDVYASMAAREAEAR